MKSLRIRKSFDGEVFGRLTVVKDVEDKVSSRGSVKRRVECVCECGNTVVVTLGHLRSGRTSSCGCLHAEIAKRVNTSHGMTNTRPFKIWCKMRQRCTDPNIESFKNYGGRGIKYSEEWETFEGFWEDMQEGYSDDLTLDRIDVNGNYCKENCRWATYTEQARNQRTKSNNKSGKSGVRENSKGKFEAYITADYKQIYLGTYLTFEEAVAAREAGELKYHGKIKQPDAVLEKLAELQKEAEQLQETIKKEKK